MTKSGFLVLLQSQPNPTPSLFSFKKRVRLALSKIFLLQLCTGITNNRSTVRGPMSWALGSVSQLWLLR